MFDALEQENRQLKLNEDFAEMLTHLKTAWEFAFSKKYKIISDKNDKENFKNAKKIFFDKYRSLSKEDRALLMNSIDCVSGKTIREVLEKDLLINIF